MKISISSNKELVAQVRAALKENDGYCPCMPQKTPATKCMCENFLTMDEGECICGLYTKSLQ